MSTVGWFHTVELHFLEPVFKKLRNFLRSPFFCPLPTKVLGHSSLCVEASSRMTWGLMCLGQVRSSSVTLECQN